VRERERQNLLRVQMQHTRLVIYHISWPIRRTVNFFV